MNSSMERKRPRNQDELPSGNTKIRRLHSLSDVASPQNLAMIQRCMQRYNWTLDYGTEVLEAYWIFLGFKKAIGDWDGIKLAAPLPIDGMWRDALLDTCKYSEDCTAEFGRMIHYNPDRNFDAQARKARCERTMTMVELRFGAHDYNRSVWQFGSSSGDTTTPTSVSPCLTSSTKRVAFTGSLSGHLCPASQGMSTSSSDSRSSSATAKPKPAATAKPKPAATAKPKPAATAKPKPAATAQTKPTAQAVRPQQTAGTISQSSKKTTAQQQQKVSSCAHASRTKDPSQKKATAARPASRPSGPTPGTSTLAGGVGQATPSRSGMSETLVVAKKARERGTPDANVAKLTSPSTSTLSKEVATASSALTVSCPTKNANDLGSNTRGKISPTLQKAMASLLAALAAMSPAVLSKEANTRDLVAKPKPVAMNEMSSTQEAAAAARRASIPPIRKKSSTGSGPSKASKSVQQASMSTTMGTSVQSGPPPYMNGASVCRNNFAPRWSDMYGQPPQHISFWSDPVSNMIHMPNADMDDSDVVFIIVSRAKSPDLTFKFGKSTKLCNLFAVYEHCRNFLSPSVTFTLYGQKLDGNDTPETAGMDPGTCVKIRAKYGRKKS